MLSGLEGQVDMEDMVLAINVAGCVLALTSLLGLCIACSRAGSWTHAVSATLYFVTSLPVWAAGGFVIAYCLIFRDEADRMVKLYWHCLALTEPAHVDGAVERTAWEAAAAVYQSITLTAALIGSSELLMLLGLYAASKVIGWRPVTSNLLFVINSSAALAGLAFAALAGGLLTRAATAFDVALLSLGFCMLLVSLVGLLGAKRNSRCVLRLYSSSMALVTLAMVAFIALLYHLGPDGLASNSFVNENWDQVEQIYPLSQRAFTEILAHHWTKVGATLRLGHPQPWRLPHAGTLCRHCPPAFQQQQHPQLTLPA